MKNYLAAMLSILFLTSLATHGQNMDPVQTDLRDLSGIDFFKKYSFYDDGTSANDISVTKLLWNERAIRTVNNSLRRKGISTFTQIEQRPSKGNSYYIIGHYQQPTSDHLARMSFYKIDMRKQTIYLQNLNDFWENKWRRIN